MKRQIFALFAYVLLTACGQDQSSSELSQIRSPEMAPAPASLTLAPPSSKVLRGQDAELFIEILERSGVQRQSAIESTFFQVEETFCVNGSFKFCQFSVGGGLFVRADQDDAGALIKLFRRNGLSARAVAEGRRWDLIDLECSTRFDLATRKLKSSCTFKHF